MSFYAGTVRTHYSQLLIVAAGTAQASTQGGTSVSCALTATATAAMARKSLENMFFFFFGRTFDVFGVVRKLKKWGVVVPPVATLYHFE